MADERAGRGRRRVLSDRALRSLPGALVLALVAALATGPSSVTAESSQRAFGRVIVTVQGVAGDGPAEPVRYEVDAVLSAESSRFRSGVVCRFELPLVVGGDSAVVALDVDLDALLGERVLPFSGPFAALDYREVGTGGVEAFSGAAVEGDVLLLALGSRTRGLALHLAFGARVVDYGTGAERLLTDGEAASLPDEATHPSTIVVWREEAPPDAVYLDAIYVSSDCAGDPLYEPGYVIEPAAYGPEPYGDEVEDGTGWGGVDWGYGEDHAAVDPDDGSVAPGDDDWDGWDAGDDWSGDGVNDDGSGGDDGGGWTPGDDGQNDDGGFDDGGGDDWDDGGWSDDGADDSGWSDDSGYDSGGGCGGEDDPGSEDDSVDCAGEDPGGSDSSDCAGGGDSSGGDEVDTSCDGGDGGEASSDPLDCDAEAKAAPILSGADSGGGAGAGPRPPRARRWRGWNLSPLLGFLAWWAFLRFRRGAPLAPVGR